MIQPSIVAPSTLPRPVFAILVAVVLTLHLWLLLGLSLPALQVTPVTGGMLYTRILPSVPAVLPSATTPTPSTGPAPAKHLPPHRSAAQPRHAVKAAPVTTPQGTVPEMTVSTPLTREPAAQESTEHEALDEYERWLAAMAQDRSAPSENQPAAPVPSAPSTATPPDSPVQEASTSPPVAEPTWPREKAIPLKLPPSTQLSFEVSGHVKGFDYHARGALDWHSDGARYQVRQSISMLFLGTRAQQSNGLVTARGLQPERFIDEARKERSAQLDFPAHRVQFSDGATATASIAEDAQDRLSIFIQLGAQIAAAPEHYPPGTRISFETVGVRRVDHWTFLVLGPERLHLPAGETPALKLQRLPQGDDDQTDDLWLGTELNYLPVRIRLSQGGSDYVDLQLRDHENP